MTLREKLRQRISELQFAYARTLGKAALRLSTLGARARLHKGARLNVLVDNTILSHAIMHETAWVSTGASMWGAHEIKTGYSARIPIRPADAGSREYKSIQYLPGIAHLARTGCITFSTSRELWVERLNHPAGRYSGHGYFDHNLFAGIDMLMIEQPLDLYIGPSSIDEAGIAEHQRERLARSSEPLYRAIASQLGPKNSQDAWHIWTAEVNNIFCFLTMDYSLLKSLEARRNVEPIRSLRTKIWTPEQLGEYLGLFPLNPALQIHEGASFPVRPDLYWADKKRQRPSKRERN